MTIDLIGREPDVFELACAITTALVAVGLFARWIIGQKWWCNTLNGLGRRADIMMTAIAPQLLLVAFLPPLAAGWLFAEFHQDVVERRNAVPDVDFIQVSFRDGLEDPEVGLWRGDVGMA